MTDESTCTIFSNSKPHQIGYNLRDRVYMGLQDDGRFTIHAKSAVFHPSFLNQIGIRIGKRPPVLGPKRTKQKGILEFDETKTNLIMKSLLEESKSVFFQPGYRSELQLQTIFFPSEKLQTINYPIGDFFIAYSSWYGCNVIKNSDGWVGIYMGDVPQPAKDSVFIKKHFGTTHQGITVYVVDPRKAAAKAGLEMTDQIIRHNGKESTIKKLTSDIDSLKAGDSIALDVLRLSSGEPKAIKLNLTKPGGNAKTSASLTVISPKGLARLCPNPACGQGKELARIPTGTGLSILGRKIIKMGAMNIVWYKVSYNGKNGWISQYDTNKQ